MFLLYVASPLCVLFALVLVLLCVEATAFAQSNGECGVAENGDCLTWTLDDNGTLTISGTGMMCDYDYRGGPWSEALVKKIVIESGVTSIGTNAFFLCPAESVEIPKGVTVIGRGAFAHCEELTNVTLGSGLTYLDQDAFTNCPKLTITAPRSLHETILIPKDAKVFWQMEEKKKARMRLFRSWARHLSWESFGCLFPEERTPLNRSKANPRENQNKNTGIDK